MKVGHYSGLKLTVTITLVTSLLSLEVHSQTSFPYLQYSNGTHDIQLSNNSVVNFEFLTKGTIQCITDLPSCCLNNENGGVRRWYLPNGTKLNEGGIQKISAFIANAGPQQFELELTDNSSIDNPALSGVYECEIDVLGGRESVYVGIYREQGSIIIQRNTLHTYVCMFMYICASVHVYACDQSGLKVTLWVKVAIWELDMSLNVYT